MSNLPDDLWRRILNKGLVNSNLDFRDLCCLSISCRRLLRLSGEHSLWSRLLSSDFPHFSTTSPTIPTNSSPKTLYKIRYERERERKLLAHKRAVLRLESQIAEHSRKLQEIRIQSEAERQRLIKAAMELSGLHKVRQASVALNVWQPEVIRGRQRQIVEQSVVPVDSRINALDMEIKLCKQRIAAFVQAEENAKRELDVSRDMLVSMKYHPLKNCDSRESRVGERGIKRKRLKTASSKA